MTLPPWLAKYWIYIALALLVAVLVGAIYFEGRHAGKSGEVVHEQQRTIQTQQEEGNANENAAAARVSDATKAAQQKKELDDATKPTADPNHARVLRGCLILRQQGRDTKNIPECRGS